MRRLAVVTLSFLVPIRLWILEPHVVRGTSMWPTYTDGDYLLIDKLCLRFRPLARGEVVVLHDPVEPQALLLKRVVGLPGEAVTMENGALSVESPGQTAPTPVDEPYVEGRDALAWNGTLHTDEIFVLGDHRSASVDSRSFGAVSLRSVVGTVRLRLGRLPRFLR
jgi:signal peptidase I